MFIENILHQIGIEVSTCDMCVCVCVCVCVQEFRAFELLRSSRDRINYLLTREAKIIAMTCTHAALKRKDLVQLSFKVV